MGNIVVVTSDDGVDQTKEGSRCSRVAVVASRRRRFPFFVGVVSRLKKRNVVTRPVSIRNTWNNRRSIGAISVTQDTGSNGTGCAWAALASWYRATHGCWDEAYVQRWVMLAYRDGTFAGATVRATRASVVTMVGDGGTTRRRHVPKGSNLL